MGSISKVLERLVEFESVGVFLSFKASSTLCGRIRRCGLLGNEFFFAVVADCPPEAPRFLESHGSNLAPSPESCESKGGWG